jgi:ATP-binding cassette subfamily B protein
MAHKNQPKVGGPGNKMNFGKPKNTGKTIKRLLSYVAKSKGLLVLVVLMVIISAGAGVAGTYLLAPIVDEIGFLLSTGSRDMSKLIGYIAVLAVIYLSGVAAQYSQSRIMLNISQKTLNILRKDLFDHLQDLPIKFFDTHNHGELMSRFTSDVDTVREAISQGLIQTISSLITVTGIFIMMLYISPALTCLIIGMLVIMLMIIKFIGKRSSNYFRKQQIAVGRLNGYIEKCGYKIVKVPAAK